MGHFLVNRRYWRFFDDSNLSRFQRLFRQGVSPNYEIYDGSSLFHEAVRVPYDNIRVVQEFLNAGADVNGNLHLAATPLHYAVFFRKRQVFKALIQSGALVNAQDLDGRTVLHLAVTRGMLIVPNRQFYFPPSMEIIDTLLEHETIDCNIKDFKGNTPLILAVKEEQQEIVKKLLRKKANPNICNKDLETPLHLSFSQPATAIDFHLLLNGANIFSVDKCGLTPLDVLLREGLKGRTFNWMLLTLKIIAFKFTITNDFKKKFEFVPHFSSFFNNCCNEVDHMRRDFISEKFTVHDLIWKCFNVDSEDLLRQVHINVIERLVKDVYPIFFTEIIETIPVESLRTVLEMTANLRKRSESERKIINLADLFSNLDIIDLFLKYFQKIDIFCLIVAVSDVKVAMSMRNLRERKQYFIFEYFSLYS